MKKASWGCYGSRSSSNNKAKISLAQDRTAHWQRWEPWARPPRTSLYRRCRPSGVWIYSACASCRCGCRWRGRADTGTDRGSERDSGCECASLFCRTVCTGAGCSRLAICQTLAACARLLNLQNQNNRFKNLFAPALEIQQRVWCGVFSFAPSHFILIKQLQDIGIYYQHTILPY